MQDLMRKIESEAGDARVLSIRVHLGALSHFTVEHFRTHFEDAARGTCAEEARVDATLGADPTEDGAQGVRLESIELEV